MKNVPKFTRMPEPYRVDDLKFLFNLPGLALLACCCSVCVFFKWAWAYRFFRMHVVLTYRRCR
jgi:hypothetical protein